MIKPVWVGDTTLLLVRRVYVNGRAYVQGSWLDWPAIEQWLLGEVNDLLPDADLEPVSTEPDDERARLLAALPFRFVPGATPNVLAASTSPIQVSLLSAWVCVLLSHLIENVLAYARLERRGTAGRVEPVVLRTLLDQVQKRLGGDLVLDERVNEGACFVLQLRLPA